jgi:DNA end-binding protein Ku
MPRSIWRGAISFGMVSIPIRLYTATDSKDVSFNMLHKPCHTRIKLQRYCPAEETVIEWGDVERAYEYAKDQYVVLDDADFEKVPVSTTHTIEITSFVSLAEVDPQYYEKAYYIEPEAVGKKPYALLLRTLQETGRVAVAQVSLRQKEQLTLLRPRGNVILMHTMFYPDEVKATDDLALPGEDVTLTEGEMKMAHALVDMLTAEFEPAQYHDNYREQLLAIIEQKVNGQVIAAPAAPQGAKAADLMATLRASIEEAKKERAGKATAGKAAAAESQAAEQVRPARRRKAG